MDAQQLANLTPEEKRRLLTELLQKKIRSTKSVFPLSHNQRAMWFLHKLAPTSSAYHLAMVLYIQSELDVAALKRALQALVNRHSILRTNYKSDSGGPVQEVRGYLDAHVEEIDASGWDDTDLEQQIVRAYKAPFNLAQGPPLRIHLFTRMETDHTLLLTLHHISFDGWSVWLLLDELRTLYAVQGNNTIALPPLNYRYTDYVQWQAEMLNGPEGERMWNYWHQQLGGDLPVLKLPTDWPRPGVRTYQGATCHFTLDEVLTRKAKALAIAEGATLYMVLLAAFQALLHRYSGQVDILVGSPMSGRSRSEFSQIVGDFINMVVLRTDFSQNPSFRDLLNQVRHTVLDALAHQDYPFSLLVERLAPKRDPSRSPLFDVSFALQRPQRYGEITGSLLIGDNDSQLEFGGLQLRSLKLIQEHGQLDLSLDFIEIEEMLIGIFRYNTDLYRADTITRLKDHFQTLVEGIVSNLDEKVSNLPLTPSLNTEFREEIEL